MTKRKSVADTIVTIDGQPMRVADIPEPSLRHMFGLGHFNPYNRAAMPGTWPYTPDTCEFDNFDTKWINDGQVLVCTGCGLDCT